MPSQTEQPKQDLLEQVQSAVHLERQLTQLLEKVEPWTTRQQPTNGDSTSTPPYSWNSYRSRVRPIPSDMKQMQEVLSVARHVASRTSAPAGWNPQAPLTGFSTPNPLPHQLRGGVLAARQLEDAKQAERDEKRRKLEEKRMKIEESKKLEGKSETNSTSGAVSEDAVMDPKRRENQVLERKLRAGIKESIEQRGRRPSVSSPTIQDTSMNLSDSSSDEEDD